MNQDTGSQTSWLEAAARARMAELDRRGKFGFGFSRIAARFRKKGQRYGGKYRKLQGSKGWRAGKVYSGKSENQHSFNPKDPERQEIVRNKR